MRFSISSGVVSKPKASASGSTLVVEVVAAAAVVVPFSLLAFVLMSLVLSLVVVCEGMVSNPRAWARESAAERAGLGAV